MQEYGRGLFAPGSGPVFIDDLPYEFTSDFHEFSFNMACF
jgi:hypothetical protein